MDLWNNSVGIELGSREDLRHMSVRDLFDYAIANNMLILDPYEVDNRFGISEDFFGGRNWTVMVAWNVLGYDKVIWSQRPGIDSVTFSRSSY